MTTETLIDAITEDGSMDANVLNATRYMAAGFVFDRRRGLGAVPDVDNVAYMGFMALMKPIDFLRYAGRGLRLETVSHIVNEKPDLSPGYLDIRIDPETKECRVVSHEGRARMTAIAKLDPEATVPVAIFVQEGNFRLRHHHLEPWMFSRIQEGLWSQRSEATPSQWIAGPVFLALAYENSNRELVSIDYVDRPAAAFTI